MAVGRWLPWLGAKSPESEAVKLPFKFLTGQSVDWSPLALILLGAWLVAAAVL
jgi:hypothetical protein